jgi:hypothetical protein
MNDTLDLETLRTLNAGHIGTRDVACPLCGPKCRTTANRKRDVLRIWDDGEFLTYKCARCEAHGWARADAHDGQAPRPVQPKLDPSPDKSELARFLWSKSLPARGSLAERYLASRSCWCASDNLRFLPSRGDHPPAMIARFDSPAQVTGVHLTKLKPDGLGKAGTDKDKIMIGPSLGQPIIVHENEERGEIFIAEGIEDAASLAIATGWTAWAAGSAGRIASVLPLARRFEKVFIPMDRDRAGRFAIERCLTIRPDVTPLRLWRALPSDNAADANKALIAFGPDTLLAAIEWCDALAAHAKGIMGFNAMQSATERAAGIFRHIAGDGLA